MVTHGGTSTSRGRRRRVCREDARCVGRDVVVVAVVESLSLSCFRPAQHNHRVTHICTHTGRSGEEKQTMQRVTPVKKADQAPEMQVAFRDLVGTARA